MTNYSSEPALYYTASVGRVAQLTGHSNAEALDIAIVTADQRINAVALE